MNYGWHALMHFQGRVIITKVLTSFLHYLGLHSLILVCCSQRKD